jgi:hypothetical protein
MTDDRIVMSSTGGFIPPSYILETFTLTYRVRNPLRRWWLRRHGWSTEWVVEYEPTRVRDLLPAFIASRGGVFFR